MEESEDKPIRRPRFTNTYMSPPEINIMFENGEVDTANTHQQLENRHNIRRTIPEYTMPDDSFRMETATSSTMNGQVSQHSKRLSATSWKASRPDETIIVENDFYSQRDLSQVGVSRKKVRF